MKKLKVACDFEGRSGSLQVWVGRPAPGFSALHFQAAWLREERGGRVAEEAGEGVGESGSAIGGELSGLIRVA